MSPIERLFGIHQLRIRVFVLSRVYRHSLFLATEPDLFAHLERDFLMSQSDLLLNQLNWSPEEGKQFLVEKYSLTSRQLLSDWQLADARS